MKIRTQRLRIVMVLPWLVMAAPSIGLAQRVYEGTGTEEDGPGDFRTLNVQITVARVEGAESQRFITYRRRSPASGEFFGRGTTFEVTLSGTGFSGAVVGNASDTITGSISCDGTIDGVATQQGSPLFIRIFRAECFSGCEDTSVLPPECQEEEEEEEEEEGCEPPLNGFWQEPGGGDFFDADNWAIESVPGAGFAAIFSGNVVNGGTVTMNQGSTSDALVVRDDVLLLQSSQGFFYTLTEASGCPFSLDVSFADDPNKVVAFLGVGGGTINAQSVRIGGAKGSTGTVELDSAFLNSETLCVVGDSGVGLLNILSAGGLFSGNDVELGRNSTATGDLVAASKSQIEIQNRLIVGVRGIGFLQAKQGAVLVLEPGAQVVIGQEAAPESARFVSAINITDPGSRIIGAGAITIGEKASSNGILSVTDGANAIVATLRLGLEANAVGTVTVFGVDGFLESQQDMIVGQSGIGRVDITNRGKLKAGRLTLAAGEGSQGTVEIVGTGRFDFETEIEVKEFTVIGETGTGTLTIKNGAVVKSGLAAGSDLEASSIAARPGSRGTVIVDGEGTEWLTSVLNVGFGGTGELFVRSGGEVTSREAILGNTIDGIGEVELTDKSSWTIDGRLIVSLAGIGRIDADDTSDLFCDELFTGANAVMNVKNIFVGPGGGGPAKLRQRSQSQDEHGVFTNRLVVAAGAQINAERLTLRAGGEITGDGVANLDIISEGTIDPGGEEDETAEFTINGDLTLEGDSEVQVDIGGLIPGEEYDVLIVNGHCQLGGKLKINLVNGYLPNVGDRFEVLKYESREGEYDTIDSDGTGVYFMPELANGRLTLIAAAVDESGRLSPEELADLALMQGACAPGCGPMGLMPLGLTLLGMCGLRAGVKRGTGRC